MVAKAPGLLYACVASAVFRLLILTLTLYVRVYECIYVSTCVRVGQVSSGSGSEAGRVSPAPPPAPAAAGAKPASVSAAKAVTATLRVPSPRRAVTPAAVQLAAASRQVSGRLWCVQIQKIGWENQPKGGNLYIL